VFFVEGGKFFFSHVFVKKKKVLLFVFVPKKAEGETAWLHQTNKTYPRVTKGVLKDVASPIPSPPFGGKKWKNKTHRSPPLTGEVKSSLSFFSWEGEMNRRKSIPEPFFRKRGIFFLSFLVAAVGGALGRCHTAVVDVVEALDALALASAAQPTTADAVLLVEANGQRACAAVAAWAASIRTGAGHEGNVRWGEDGIAEPGRARRDVVGGDGAVAVDAGSLLELVALLLRALSQWAVVFVLAQELVGAVAAVLDAVAALSVGNDLSADALETVGQAGASDVVAHWAGASHEGKQGNQKKSSAHCCLFDLEVVVKAFF
jgi:hypothetical protein